MDITGIIFIIMCGMTAIALIMFIIKIWKCEANWFDSMIYTLLLIPIVLLCLLGIGAFILSTTHL